MFPQESSGAVQRSHASQPPQPGQPTAQALAPPPLEPKFQVLLLKNTSQPEIKEYKRRTYHSKTRLGCIPCKQKRVKCDRTEPFCLRCLRNHRDCRYEGLTPTASTNGEAKDGSPGIGGSSSAYGIRKSTNSGSDETISSSTDTNATPKRALTRPPQDPHAPPVSQEVLLSLPAPVFPRTMQEHGTPSSLLMQHFTCEWEAMFDLPNTTFLVPLSLDHPHLRETLLAVAASHLRHISPGTRDHRLAEHFQQGLALRDYQAALSAPLSRLGKGGIDALIITAMMMNLLSFVLPVEEDDPVAAAAGVPPDPARSWVFSPREDRLGWLGLQMGLTTLLLATRPWRGESILGPIFERADNRRGSFHRSRWCYKLDKVPEPWLAVFGLIPLSCASPPVSQAPPPSRGGHLGVEGCEGPTNTSAAPTGAAAATATATAAQIPEFTPTRRQAYALFAEPLRILVEIDRTPATRGNLLRYFQFVGKLLPEYLALLEGRDEHALWAFGYWLGLMCRFSHVWWCGRRPPRDYAAVKAWLYAAGVDRRPGEVGRLWRLLMADLEGVVERPGPVVGEEGAEEEEEVVEEKPEMAGRRWKEWQPARIEDVKPCGWMEEISIVAGVAGVPGSPFSGEGGEAS